MTADPSCRCIQHPPFLGWPAYIETGGCPIHASSVPFPFGVALAWASANTATSLTEGEQP